MIGQNRKEKERLIVNLYNNGSTYREIAKEARISLRDIKGILDKANGVQSLSKSSQAYTMFSEVKSPTDVAIALEMREPEVTQLYKESWTLKQIYDLNSIYLEAKGDLGLFVKLFKLSKAAGLTIEHVIKLLLVANNDLPSIEQKCQDLKREEADLTAKNLDAVRTFQQLGNDISEEYRILDQCRSSCRGERLELARLRLQKEKLELIVKQFQNDNEDLRRIKEFAKQAVEQSLVNYRYLLKIAFFSIIDSCRYDPIKFSILYHNLPTTISTTDTQLFLSDQNNHYNNRLSTDKQLHYKNNDNDTYYKLLVDEAERFFNGRVKELTQDCISRLTELCISA